jgi:hypothetical protein
MVTGAPDVGFVHIGSFFLEETSYHTHMNCTKCGIFPVPEAREEAGYHTCMSCAQRVRPVRGTMIYTQKTNGFIEIHDADAWQENKKYYVPQGRSCVKRFSKNVCA